MGLKGYLIFQVKWWEVTQHWLLFQMKHKFYPAQLTTDANHLKQSFSSRSFTIQWLRFQIWMYKYFAWNLNGGGEDGSQTNININFSGQNIVTFYVMFKAEMNKFEYKTKAATSFVSLSVGFESSPKCLNVTELGCCINIFLTSSKGRDI